MSQHEIGINSPEILLNSWIDMNVRIMFDRGFKNREKIGKMLLAHILAFAEEHEKLIEMFNWLQTDHATRCLKADGEDQGGVWVLNAIENFPFNKNESVAAKLDTYLQKYMDRHLDVMKYKFELNNPVYVHGMKKYI